MSRDTLADPFPMLFGDAVAKPTPRVSLII